MTAPRVEPIDSQWRPMCRKFNERAVEVMEREGVVFGERTSPYSGLCVNELRELYITELEKRQAEKMKTDSDRIRELKVAAQYFAYGLIMGMRGKPKRHERPVSPILSMKHILREVCWKHGVTKAEMESQRRTRHITKARQEFYYRATMETPASFPQIGKMVGNRDHTTVLHGARVYAERNGLPRHDRANNGAR